MTELDMETLRTIFGENVLQDARKVVAERDELRAEVERLRALADLARTWREVRADRTASGGAYLRACRALAEAVDGLDVSAEVERFHPVTDPSGDALYIRCGHVEWWNESVNGPINDQGCDACESAPDGSWRPLYLRTGGA
jgi:hypothetical protein